MSKPKIFETTFLAHPCGVEMTHEGADVEFSPNSGGPGMVVPASDNDARAIAPFLQSAVRVTVIVEPVEGEEMSTETKHTSGPWKKYATEQPTEAGIYEWRVPSVAVLGLTVRFLAHLRERGAGFRTVLSPAFGYWDGCRVHVPEGTEWRECDSEGPTTYDYANLAVEGLLFAPCIYCERQPTLKAVERASPGLVVCAVPHRFNTWWLECCPWGTTPDIDDPRKIEAFRRKAFGRINAELLEALEAMNDAFRVDRAAFTESQRRAVTLADVAMEKATGEKLEPLSEDEIAAV